MADDRPADPREAKDLSDAEAKREFWADDPHCADGGWRPEDRWDLMNEFLPFVTFPMVLVKIFRDFRDSLREGRETREGRQ